MLECRKINGAADRVAIDEEEGSSVHSKTVTFPAVGFDRLPEPMAIEVSRKLWKIETKLLCFGNQVVSLKLVLAGEQEVVHFPEFPLFSGCEGGFMS